MKGLRRWERLIRSQILGSPFVIANLLTRYEVDGAENIEAALELRRERGCGLITISNHLSLFDDPFVFVKLLKLMSFNVESKRWWSTPCESNFNPRGEGLGPWFVRYFSDVSNMVFFARPAKVGRKIELPEAYAPVLEERGGRELMDRLEARAAAEGVSVETLLRRYLTTDSDPDSVAMLNQPGMVEACARVGLGDWLHFFPEGGRSRSLHLKSPRQGVGKVLAHNPEALVLPICFYGTQDVMPVHSVLPRLFKRVVVSIGEPYETRRLLARHPGDLTRGLFHDVAASAWGTVTALRPLTLARYLGPAKAAALLRAEAPASVLLTGEAVGLPTESSRPERSIDATGARTRRDDRRGDARH